MTGHIRSCRHMCSSTKPPGSKQTSDEPEQKQSHSNDGSQMPSGMKITNYIREKNPEVYSLGQQISEKSSSLISSLRQTSITAPAGEAGTKKPEDWNDILNRWYQQYQDFIGITSLKTAQDRVTELSEVLHGVQSKRRELQAEIEDIQEKQVVNHDRINKTELYSKEHFTLLEQARQWNDQLKVVRSDFAQCERLERDTFTQMSAAIRDCHEQERMQAEQSKYWSIIASVVSAALASLITSVNNWVRIREIKDHVTSKGQHLLDGFQQMHQDVLDTIKALLATTAHPQPERGNPAGTVQALFSMAENDSPVSPNTTQTKNSTSTLLETKQHNGDISGPLPAKVTKEDVVQLTEELRQKILDQINENLAKERKLLLEQMNEKLKAYLSHVVSEGDRTRDEIVSMVKILTEAVSSSLETNRQSISMSEEHQEAPVVVVNYSYGRIATAMAVGAGIGTLATAFALKAFGGSGV
ncbi:uncharacterized protein LOC121873814 isoform X2 [Homarus americanus]|nr:uncharacterized protein LOC121873814 isoform X2 [Homarus americanus]